jgi:DNA-binding MarR family transcriptional regulator
MLLEFMLELSPLIWPRDENILQTRAFTVVFVSHLSGKALTCSELASRLGYPRGTVQYNVDRLIDRGRIKQISDPNDARKRLLVIPRSMAAEAGAIETLLVDFRMEWHRRLEELLQQRAPATAAEFELEALKNSILVLASSLESRNPDD